MINYIQLGYPGLRLCILRGFVVWNQTRVPGLCWPTSATGSTVTHTVLFSSRRPWIPPLCPQLLHWSGATGCRGTAGRTGLNRRMTTTTTMVVVAVLLKRNGIEQGGLTLRHEWQVPQGGPGRLPGPAEGGNSEGPQRAGWGWHDTDVMGRLSRQLGGAAADRGEGVRSIGVRPSHNIYSNMSVRVG